jgi:hypothetical protein
MSTMADLRPGDIMCGPIGGFIPGVVPVGAGEVALMPWKQQLRFETYWRIRHIAVVTQAQEFAVRIGQAMPSGFEEVQLGMDRWTDGHVFIRPPYRPLGLAAGPASPESGRTQGDDVADHAREMARRKIPYGWLDYAAIPAHRLHLPVPHLDAFIAATDPDGYPRRAICSQAGDACLTMAGYHLFADGRLPQDVTPADVYLQLITTPGAMVIRPGYRDWVVMPSASINYGPGAQSYRKALLAAAIKHDLV